MLRPRLIDCRCPTPTSARRDILVIATAMSPVRSPSTSASRPSPSRPTSATPCSAAKHPLNTATTSMRRPACSPAGATTTWKPAGLDWTTGSLWSPAATTCPASARRCGTGGSEPPVPHRRADAGHVVAAGDHNDPVVQSSPAGFQVVVAPAGEHAGRLIDVVAVFRGCFAAEQGVADVGLDGLGLEAEVLGERTGDIAVAITKISRLAEVGVGQRQSISLGRNIIHDHPDNGPSTGSGS